MNLADIQRVKGSADKPHPLLQPVADYLTALQESIRQKVEFFDGKAMEVDAWERPDQAGYGVSCLLEEGNVFERAGIGYSYVKGKALPPSATATRPQLAGAPFEVAGVSLVFHPRNPYVPTVHMNVRCFMAFPKDEAPVWWFGGGMDLTPYYGFVEDAIHFHHECKAALDPYGDVRYPLYKEACDRYFYLKHRQEARGIGGIFYDDVNDADFDTLFAMTRSVGDHFIKAYFPIVMRRSETLYGERERDFQAYRRGRYVEFNLLYDRGTVFGLQSEGRTESILMSMPPVTRWRYQWSPEKSSPEARLYSEFLVEKDWLGVNTLAHSELCFLVGA